MRGRRSALQEVEPRCPKPPCSAEGGGGGAAGAGLPAKGRLLSQAWFCVLCECVDLRQRLFSILTSMFTGNGIAYVMSAT